MIILGFLKWLALFCLTMILFVLNFKYTGGEEVGLIAVNVDVVRFIAMMMSETTSQVSNNTMLFRASGAVQVMFALELFMALYMFFSAIGWWISLMMAVVTPARIPGSFPNGREAPVGHGDAKVKSPGVVMGQRPDTMDTRTGGMRTGGGGFSEI